MTTGKHCSSYNILNGHFQKDIIIIPRYIQSFQYKLYERDTERDRQRVGFLRKWNID